MATFKRTRPTIGVLTGWQVYTGIIDSFLEHVIRGIKAASTARGCNLLLACGASTTNSFGEGRPGWPIRDQGVDFLPVGPWNCDGIIVIPPTMAVKACEQYAIELEGKGIPVIFAGLQGFGPGVGTDNAMGIRQAVQHLCEHGHRRIAFLAGYDFDHNGDSGSRYRAYCESLEEFGIPFDPDLVAYGFHENARGQQAMQQILARKVPFSAVMASNDLTAIGAREVLHQAGLQIPQDVALIGFDNRIETRAQTPPLTTIHFPMFELGYQSLEMMLDRLDGRVGQREIRLIPTHLVVRESCGCPPGETGKVIRECDDIDPILLESSKTIDQTPEWINERKAEQEIALIIQTESHRIRRSEAILLTQRCVEAFRESLAVGNPLVFLGVFQEILDLVSDWQNDLLTWQYAITILRECPPLVADARLQREEVDKMLDRARVLVSEAARAQSTRQLIRQAQLSEQLEVMTNRFFAAQDEDEIFAIMNQYLPAIGIEQNAVLYYQAEEDDAYAISSLQSPHAVLGKGYLFDTYEFPPLELISDHEPFQHALLPLTIDNRLSGYLTFKVGPLEPLADIVRQLGASLSAVRLRQNALENQRMAEEANQLKSRFLSMVSHELRAPLNLITGLSDIILKNRNADVGPNFPIDDIERINISAQYLDGLIQDVLDLTLIDIGQLKINREPLNLKEVLDSIASICIRLVKDKGLNWRYEVDENLPRVWGDRTRIRQVTWNLLNNAIKFTEHGEVMLKAAVTEQGLVAVSVSDTGVGIPSGEEEIIFQEFRQSERTAARGYGGLGLGLAICKRLVELQGGEISVCSSGRKNLGAVFTFTLLPVVSQAALLPVPVETTKDTRVLLMMENPRTSSVIQRYLAEKGHDVGLYSKVDGDEWLTTIFLYNPDVIVMDLEMTSTHGWEVLKAMKENPTTQEIPLLFYAVSNDGQTGSFLELDYLTKPVKSELLTETLLNYHLADQCHDLETAPVILVVDDDVNTVELHSRMILSQFPRARIRQAGNGRQALELIRQEPPSLVLLDLMMPEMDGFAVLSEMRDYPGCEDIPIIVITSQSLNQHDMNRLNQGVVSILGKNIFTKDEALQHIAKVLQNRSKRSSETQQAIFKAMAFIHTQFKHPISRSDIAASVGLSERHLDRCFQHGLGISPITYLNRYRVYQACNLLKTQKLGITAVAMEVGFSSSGYFARVFRDEMGVSPRVYLENLNNAAPK